MRILITGATGFVGRHLCEWLVDRGYRVRATARTGSGHAAMLPAGVEQVAIADIRALGSPEDWRHHLEGVDGVVHLAGLAHAIRQEGQAAEAAFRAINEDPTRILSQAAVRYGIGRLVLVSTVKVFGEETSERPFTEHDQPMPQDAYARSKLMAEHVLQKETRGTACNAVIVRPPLVYGRGVKGNFPRLVRLVRSGVPLPFGAVDNRRTIVSVWNLCDLLERALTHHGAIGHILLPTDDRPVSTPELLRLMASAMQVHVRLASIPPSLLRVVGRLLGGAGDISRLIGSLEVDGTETRSTLQWQPPLSIEDGLARTLGEPR